MSGECWTLRAQQREGKQETVETRYEEMLLAKLRHKGTFEKEIVNVNSE